jgi:hypothetical protein
VARKNPIEDDFWGGKKRGGFIFLFFFYAFLKYAPVVLILR